MRFYVKRINVIAREVYRRLQFEADKYKGGLDCGEKCLYGSSRYLSVAHVPAMGGPCHGDGIASKVCAAWTIVRRAYADYCEVGALHSSVWDC